MENSAVIWTSGEVTVNRGCVHWQWQLSYQSLRRHRTWAEARVSSQKQLLPFIRALIRWFSGDAGRSKGLILIHSHLVLLKWSRGLSKTLGSAVHKPVVSVCVPDHWGCVWLHGGETSRYNITDAGRDTCCCCCWDMEHLISEIMCGCKTCRKQWQGGGDDKKVAGSGEVTFLFLLLLCSDNFFLILNRELIQPVYLQLCGKRSSNDNNCPKWLWFIYYS